MGIFHSALTTDGFAKTYEMMVLPVEDGLSLESGKEIMWMEALGRYKIIRDH